MTRLEATYLEAIIGFDRWCEIDWDRALRLTLARLDERAEDGERLPRSEVFEMVAANENPKSGRSLFRSRVADLVEVMADSERPPHRLRCRNPAANSWHRAPERH